MKPLLSRRQLELVQILYTNPKITQLQVAEKMGLQESTVKQYLSVIRAILDLPRACSFDNIVGKAIDLGELS